MKYTSIVTPSDLAQYADTRESQGIIPELVYLLIKQSVSDISECRIPYGDAVNQPGMDGVVDCKTGFLEFVPSGKSYWEIGTGKDPQEKASSDFQKRTEELSDEERANSTFVFATPRSAEANGWDEPKQRAWIKRQQGKGWKRIIIIDGVKLADWLREFPATGRWIAAKIGILPNSSGIITPLEHWNLTQSKFKNYNLIQSQFNGLALPPELFISSRDKACSALESIFLGKAKKLFIIAESENDVDDFVAAYLMTLEKEKAQKYADRCLFIKDKDTWQAISELRRSHVLVASPRLGLDDEQQNLLALAIEKGHGVIVPFCDASSNGNDDVIDLKSPPSYQIKEILTKAQFPDVLADEFAKIGNRRLSALMRYLVGVAAPSYAKRNTVRELAKACLIGRWDERNEADVKIIEKFIGKSYKEWMEKFIVDALRPDSPLTLIEGKWKVISRDEAWDALGDLISNDDLARFKNIAISVLEERDPALDLPKEERYAASIYGKQLNYSQNIRKGISQTLALMGSRPQALSNCSCNEALNTVNFIVRTLLDGADWERWASTDACLPLLAEAAPSEFLDAVESALVDISNSPFHEIFEQEGGGIEGRNYMCDLLWALEGLAWSPDYLSRVAVVLADLASIDPGGSWANRPIRSLVNIFLPWHVQTAAKFDKRKAAIKAVIKNQPKIGWSLLLELLPEGCHTTSGNYRPIWRDFIPLDWKDGVFQYEYLEQITALSELVIDLAKEDVDKFIELIERLSNLPKNAYDFILDYCLSDSIINLPEEKRDLVWEKLDEIVRRHRKFSDTNWALPEEELCKIKNIADSIAPSSPEIKYRYLFNGVVFELLDEDDSYDKQIEKLAKKRNSAIKEILNSGGLIKCINFAKKVASPLDVGRALGEIEYDLIENELLPTFLDSDDKVEKQVLSGYARIKFYKIGIDWVDMIMQKDWSLEQRAKFLLLLPFNEEVWETVSKYLGENSEGLYWKNIRVNPYESDGYLNEATEKLLTHGREGAAVICAAHEENKDEFNEALAVRSLISALNSESGTQELINYSHVDYDVVKLIKRLQKSKTIDQDVMLKIEFKFFPWIKRFSREKSPTTIEKKLASDPQFFADMIALAFRSKHDKSDNTKEIDENKRYLAQNAYDILYEWKHCPGVKEDGKFDENAFKEWVKEAKRITEETGHIGVARHYIGQSLTYAPADPGGLWIHKAVADILDERDADKIRPEFTLTLFNRRGIHTFTYGREERELAKQNQEKAEDLDAEGFTRFAAAMRKFAEQYTKEAEMEEKRDIYEEYD
ncbi:hypothetical protein [uncultured Campylobacter sp.]|uniref:hypothetical protein n=1 Tax=uncultured Campylobacter sp. TaxID=218934 RepID=UPI00261CFA45|nr:hypothetical protein [uncultured Campylobacter sp.]